MARLSPSVAAVRPGLHRPRLDGCLAVRGAEIRRYRRFKGYDYSRGAVVFVTFAVAGRKRIFGKVEGDKVVYSKAGEVACAVLAK